MSQVNFVAIGKIPGECIFIHKQDLIYLNESGSGEIIKCITIDLESKRISDAVTINDLQNICPHDPINSRGEREVIEDLVTDLLSEADIKELNKHFEQIRYQE